MIERSETDLPQSPETRIPHEPSYEIKRRLAFLLDDLFESAQLKETNTRINLRTINRLRMILGDKVTPLEKVIVDSRFRTLRGLAAVLFGQAGMTGALSIGNIPPELYSDTLKILFFTLAAGNILDGLDKDRTYKDVREAANLVMHHLVVSCAADIYDLPLAKKRVLANTLADSIAKGECLARPELTTIIYTLLNSPILLATNQAWIGVTLTVLEAIFLVHIRRNLKNASEEKQTMEKGISQVADDVQADDLFGTDLAEPTYLTTTEVQPNEKSKFGKALVQLLTQFALPALAINSQGGLPLAFAQVGQLYVHVSPIHTSEREFAAGRDGNRELKDILDLVEKNDISLVTDERWIRFCTFIKGQNLETVKVRDSDNLLAIIGPFYLKYPAKDAAQLTMNEPLELNAGLHLLKGRTGGGESAFLQAITQRIKTVQKKESVIKTVNQTGSTAFARLHDLGPREITNLVKYLYPETKESKLSPLALFSRDILGTPPIGYDPYIQDLILRYQQKEKLSIPENRAIGRALQLMKGQKTEDQIRKEVLRSWLPEKEKAIILRLLQFARLIDVKKRLIKKLSLYPFFNENDLKELNELKKGEAPRRQLRTKLRVVKALEDAERKGTKIIAIDNTLDPITNKETPLIIAFLGEWSTKNKVCILLATREKLNKNLILRSPHYLKSIFFDANGIVGTGKEKPDEE